MRPWPAGELVPCVTVRESSDGEESLDAYPRRAVGPTQPWPPRSADVGVQTDISAVDACPFDRLRSVSIISVFEISF